MYIMGWKYLITLPLKHEMTSQLQFFDNKSKHDVQHIFCFRNLSKIHNYFLHLWSTWWLMSCGRGKILWLASGLFSRAVGTGGGGREVILPRFWQISSPYLNRGGYYAHNSATPPPLWFSDLPTALQDCRKLHKNVMLCYYHFWRLGN